MSEGNGAAAPEPPESAPRSQLEAFMRQHFGVVLCGFSGTNPGVDAVPLVITAARAAGFVLGTLLITDPLTRQKTYEQMRKAFRDGMEVAPRLEMEKPKEADTAIPAGA